MKYKDYYATLGVERTASADEIKDAYRRLARKYHPDVSKETNAEARFKEMAEAYATLKDPQKREAYDQLGRPGANEGFRPPPEWSTRFGGGGATFDDMDFADLFAGLAGRYGRGGASGQRGGQDYEVTVPVSIEDAYHGTEITLDLSTTEFDEKGVPRHVPRQLKARIPKGVTDAQVLRLSGQGGKGAGGGRDGDIYLHVVVKPHPRYRATGHDLYVDLPVAPWEAALGATVEVSTPGGAVNLKVPEGTRNAQQLRLSGRGLPNPQGKDGDLYAIVTIAMAPKWSERERELFGELAAASSFKPRGTNG